MADRSNDALIALRKIQQRTDQASKTLAQAVGLTPSQLTVLQHLDRNGDTSAGELAKVTQLKHATITALVDKLVEREFVSRYKYEGDRRVVWLRLDPEGLAAIRSAPNLLQEDFRERFDKLVPWQQSMLVSALEQVATLLNAENLDAAPVLHAGEINEKSNPVLGSE